MIIERGKHDAEARFSDDRRHRYLLRRNLGERPLEELIAYRTCVFAMLNPSTADAFKLDPTVKRCVTFATNWGYDVLEVVNLFALRSPHPSDLYAARPADRGTFGPNDSHILTRCANADLVIAAWGNHGHDRRLSTYGGRLESTRGEYVREMLELEGVELYHLGLSKSGAPLHPLARGKSRIPYDRKIQRWAA